MEETSDPDRHASDAGFREGQGETVPAERVLLPESGAGDGPDGLRWSFEFDLATMLAEIGRPLDASGLDEQDEILAAEIAALYADPDEAGHEDETGQDRGPSQGNGPSQACRAGQPVDLTGIVTEHLPAGPSLAAWLTQQAPEEVADRDLPGAVGAFGRIASWAQAGEFAAIAQIAARSATQDKKTGVQPDGRPVRVTPDAASQVSLGLALSPGTASWWTSLAVTLRWRLPRTLAALSEGRIDAYRARMIAEATSLLSEEAARAVEEKVLAKAGDQTYAQLRSALRRAVLAADPEGAEERRQAAERRARVSLYPDDDGTATLAGTSLSSVHAAAAMARVSAMARALKASGAGGGIDLLRAHVFLGLLLGTMPLIPPRADAPPDDPLPDHSPSEDPAPDDSAPDDPPSDDSPPGDGGPGGRGPAGDGPGGCRPDNRRRTGEDGEPRAGRPASRPRGHDSTNSAASPLRDIPGPADADAPPDDGVRDTPVTPDPDDDQLRYGDDPLDLPCIGPVPALPPIPARLTPDSRVMGPAGLQSLDPRLDPRMDQGSADPARPPPGLLDLSLPWATFTGESLSAGSLNRIGPITAAQARQLVAVASGSHSVAWRVIVTDSCGRAIAVDASAPAAAPDRKDRLTLASYGTPASHRGPPSHRAPPGQADQPDRRALRKRRQSGG